MPNVPGRGSAIAGLAAAGLAATLAVACAPRQGRVQSAAPAAPGVTFGQVRAILRDSCEHCHNEEKSKGGLVLDSYDMLVIGGETGSPIVPRNSASSLLVQVLEGRVKPRMPYKEDPLPPAEIALIRRWIDAGAAGPSAAAVSDDVVSVDIPDIRPLASVSGPVPAVAFDSATRRIAVGSYKSVHLMSFDDRTWSGTLDGHADLVRAVAFSVDGQRLAVAGGPSGRVGEVRIWDVSGRQAKPVATMNGHKDAILSVAFSPDGTTIATGSYDKLVKLWDASTGKELRTLKEHSDAVYTVAFLPGGTELLSGAGDRTLKIWDVRSGRRLFTISDALDAIYAAAVHPSGARIAAAGADRMIRTWAWNGDPSRAGGPGATLLTSAFAHGEAVLGLAYSPDGTTLVSSGADRTIKTWDASTLREKLLFEPQPDWVLGLALSADGRWLAAGRYDGTLGVYSLVDARAGEQFVVPSTTTPRTTTPWLPRRQPSPELKEFQR
jgi:WD40 repeat protein